MWYHWIIFWFRASPSIIILYQGSLFSLFLGGGGTHLFSLDAARCSSLLSAHGQCHCVKYPDGQPNVYPHERSISQHHCPDVILQAQLIAFLPHSRRGHGKPDKSMTLWLKNSADWATACPMYSLPHSPHCWFAVVMFSPSSFFLV